jgi:hypothetical protein
MTFRKGDTVYAVGPGLGTFVGYEDRTTALVEVAGFEYAVPLAAVSPTTTYTEATCAWCAGTDDYDPADPQRELCRGHLTEYQERNDHG